EWHWRLRELLDPASGQAIALPDDAELLSDLCAPRWKITPRGIQVEDKLLTKERIGRSPDVGESVIYAFAEDSGNSLGFLEWAKQETARMRSAGESKNVTIRTGWRCLACGHDQTVVEDGRPVCAKCGRGLDT